MTTFYELFDISYGQREYTSKGFLGTLSGRIPLISSGGKNNGVYGFFDILPKYKHIISVPRTGTIGQAFYQGWNCCVDDNCLVMTPKENISDEEMVYFALLVRANKYQYVYGRQITPDRLGNTKIPDNIPDWIYTQEISDFRGITNSKAQENLPTLNISSWRGFSYSDLFELVPGRGTIPKELGSIPVISSKAINNGCHGYYNTKPRFSGNCLTITYNGQPGVSFYQSVPFTTTSDAVTLLPKFPLNPYIGLFLVSVIKQDIYRYSYGRKWSLERAKKATIKLPVDSKDKPDWQFMEDYIKSLPYSELV